MFWLATYILGCSTCYIINTISTVFFSTEVVLITFSYQYAAHHRDCTVCILRPGDCRCDRIVSMCRLMAAVLAMRLGSGAGGSCWLSARPHTARHIRGRGVRHARRRLHYQRHVGPRYRQQGTRSVTGELV